MVMTSLTVGHEVVKEEKQGLTRPKNDGARSQFRKRWDASNILAGASDSRSYLRIHELTTNRMLQ